MASRKGLCTLTMTVALLATGGQALAQGVVDLRVSGNQLTGRVELPGGIGADLTLGFESVSGLDLSTLRVTAELVNPLDLVLRSRLPAGVGIPLAFPVVIKIRPTANSKLTFQGMYTLELHTENLSLGVNSPLRLFKAPDGGKFKDTTLTMGVGSYRVRAGGGSFSEFLIVLDLRTLRSVTRTKFNDLEATLNANAGRITGGVYGQLWSLLASARSAYDARDLRATLAHLDAFTNTVRAHSGTNIPDVWKANSGLVNVAGLLRQDAGTLRFNVSLEKNGLLNGLF